MILYKNVSQGLVLSIVVETCLCIPIKMSLCQEQITIYLSFITVYVNSGLNFLQIYVNNMLSNIFTCCI